MLNGLVTAELIHTVFVLCEIKHFMDRAPCVFVLIMFHTYCFYFSDFQVPTLRIASPLRACLHQVIVWIKNDTAQSRCSCTWKCFAFLYDKMNIYYDKLSSYISLYDSKYLMENRVITSGDISRHLMPWISLCEQANIFLFNWNCDISQIHEEMWIDAWKIELSLLVTYRLCCRLFMRPLYFL